jgi:hypothetical protein
MPFINAENSSMMPVLIKYLELKYTLSLVEMKKGNTTPQNNIHASNMESDNESKMDIPFGNIENIYNAIRRYLAPNEDKKFSQLVNALKTMKSVREMQSMMEMLDINISELGGNGFDINEIMKMFGGNMNGN